MWDKTNELAGELFKGAGGLAALLGSAVQGLPQICNPFNPGACILAAIYPIIYYKPGGENIFETTSEKTRAEATDQGTEWAMVI